MDLYQDPDNVFVGGFIGSPSMNFLKAKVAGPGKVSVEALGGQEIQTKASLPAEQALTTVCRGPVRPNS